MFHVLQLEIGPMWVPMNSYGFLDDPLPRNCRKTLKAETHNMKLNLLRGLDADVSGVGILPHMKGGLEGQRAIARQSGPHSNRSAANCFLAAERRS